MLTRKKSVVSCFVIGALLCTLNSRGSQTVLAYEGGAAASVYQAAQMGTQDIRKTSQEENTREIAASAIKSTESSPSETAAARIAGASVKSGVAGYEAAAQQAGQDLELTVAEAANAGAQVKAEAEAQAAEGIAPELENKVITTVDTYQNIRLEPSEDAEVVGRLYEGSAGDVLETGDGWTKISSGGVEGWVHNDYVVSGEEAQLFAEESLEQVAVITDEGVRVRDGASIDSTWIGVVNTDEVYRVIPEDTAEEAEPETETIPETEAVPETEARTEAADAQAEAAGEDSDPASAAEIAEEELQWVKILYDGDKEGYVCADYVSTSFELGQAKSMEEIRAEEEAQAQAEAERKAEEAAAAQAAAEPAAQESVQTTAQTADSGWVYLGEFKITAYCGGACCNGKWAGTTASGATPAEGRTVAVAPWLIPYGSQVMIDGMGVYVAEDTGGFANRNPYQIDLFVADHAAAASWGVQYHEVWIKY